MNQRLVSKGRVVPKAAQLLVIAYQSSGCLKSCVVFL